jgi:H+/gluconate symporter-like permease
MNFFFAKLFEVYKRKKDSPELTITLYISLIYFFILFVLYLPASEIVNKLLFKNEFEYDKNTLIFCVFAVLSTVTFLTYNKFIKRKYIYKLAERYKTREFPKFLLYTLTALLPVFLLLLGATLTVLLKGGSIGQHKCEGLF